MLERFKVPVDDRVYVPAPQMREATEAIFRAMGLPDDDAVLAADVLMTNDLRGVESHGVSNMLSSYVAGYRAGQLNPRAELKATRETATTAVIDGGGGLGLHVAPRAMDVAIEKARESGLGAVCVHNVGHMGGSGYHAMRALPHDMIGVAMSSSGAPSVLPTFVLDMGTAQVAQNKLRLARRVGALVEPGWIADRNGTPMMKAVPVPDEYYLLPMGGTREQGSHKGYGMAAIVDIMCSTLTGIGPGFIALVPGFHLLAYRIDAFVDAGQFKRDMDAFLRGLAETPPAPGHDRVVYPGLIEAEEEQQRLREGIPYHIEVIEWFGTIAEELKLDFAFLDATAARGER